MNDWFLAIRALANIITAACVVWWIVRECQHKHTRTRYTLALATWCVLWFGVAMWANGWHF